MPRWRLTVLAGFLQLKWISRCWTEGGTVGLSARNFGLHFPNLSSLGGSTKFEANSPIDQKGAVADFEWPIGGRCSLPLASEVVDQYDARLRTKLGLLLALRILSLAIVCPLSL